MFFRTARQVVVAAIGSAVVLIGIVLLVLPGPGALTIFLGVAVLATEFAWASRLLKRMKKQANTMLGRPNPVDVPEESGKKKP